MSVCFLHYFLTLAPSISRNYYFYTKTIPHYIWITFIAVSVHIYTTNTTIAQTGYYALVIGNQNYNSTSTSNLKNAIRDADAISDALRKLGFDVEELHDGSYSEINSELDNFFKMSKKVAIFYYTGHGYQVNAVDYIISFVAEILPDSSGKTINEMFIPLKDIATRLNNTSDIAIAFLDACRTTVFYNANNSKLERGMTLHQLPSREDIITIGFSDRMALNNGIIIAYASQPGFPAYDGHGRHSPFAQGILNELRKPRLHALTIDALLSRVSDYVSNNYANDQSAQQVPSRLGQLGKNFELIPPDVFDFKTP